MNMNSINITKYFQLYKGWITKNPQRASEFECLIKWGSYMLAGRFKSSNIICEIIYSGSRLFQLFNDFIISGKFQNLTTSQINRLKVLLTMLEYVEVLIEVSAAQIWGEIGRWSVISIIQLLKLIWRMVLLFNSKSKLISSPPILCNRLTRNFQSGSDLFNNNVSNGFETQSKGVIQLNSSGRLMRSLHSTPPSHLRTFAPPTYDEAENLGLAKPTTNQQYKFTAELLHIFRPLGHLSSVFLFGENSWVPWSLAFGLDLTSLHLHEKSSLTQAEKRELTRRSFNLLYYLIRTPAFQSVTHRRIRQFLIAVGGTVPSANLICRPLLDYIPEWQKIYAYTWS